MRFACMPNYSYLVCSFWFLLFSLTTLLQLGVYYTTIHRRGGELWWIYTETQSVEVNIHRSSPTLRGIVVLVFTKSDG